MAEQKTPRQTKYALNLQSSFQILREKKFVCDFTINVGKESFAVHRAVLVARSKYFEGMFSHNMKEVQEGIVDMKDVEADAVKQCIEFMYTGDAVVTVENAESILHAASLMQIDELAILCFDYLKNNLSPENCLYVKNLAQVYDNGDIIETLNDYIIQNFEDVISTENFLLLAIDDVLLYVRSCREDFDVIWRGVEAWVKHHDERKRHVVQLLKVMKCKNLPFGSFREMWGKSLIKRSEDCKDYLVNCLFSNVDKVKQNINHESCYFIQQLCAKFSSARNAKDINSATLDYVALYFDEMSLQKGFRLLLLDDILAILDVQTRYNPMAKWKSVLEWVKHDQENRKEHLPLLLKALKVEAFPPTFIDETIRGEDLVKTSPECKDVLLDAYFSITSKQGRQTSWGTPQKVKDKWGGKSTNDKGTQVDFDRENVPSTEIEQSRNEEPPAGESPEARATNNVVQPDDNVLADTVRRVMQGLNIHHRPHRRRGWHHHGCHRPPQPPWAPGHHPPHHRGRHFGHHHRPPHPFGHPPPPWHVPPPWDLPPEDWDTEETTDD